MIKRIIFLMYLASLIIASTSMAHAGPKTKSIDWFSIPVSKVPSISQPNSKSALPPGKPLRAIRAPRPLLDESTSNIRSVRRNGSIIEACPRSGPCIRRSLPKATGKPIAVVNAPLLDEKVAPVSTLVVSNKRYSLCYLTSMKTNAQNVCLPVKAPIIKGSHIRAITYPGIGTVLSISIDPKLAPNMTREQRQKAIAAFSKGLNQAQASASKVATRRASLRTRQASIMIEGGGGGCDWDDEGGYYCSGGGESGGGGGGGGGGDWGSGGGGSSGGDDGYWSSDPSGGDDWSSPDGSNDGGGYPNDDSGNGGGDDDGGQIPIPLPFPPPGPTPNQAGGTTNCYPTPDGAACVITAPRPPSDEDKLPNNPPPQEWSWCDLPVISWFCGSDPTADPTNDDLGLPPFVWPKKPDDGKPLEKHREGYQEALNKCDKDKATDEAKCSIKYALLGGPIYKRKLEETGKLTSEERKMLQEANKEISSCLSLAGEWWGQCYKNAQDDFRE